MPRHISRLGLFESSIQKFLARRDCQITSDPADARNPGYLCRISLIDSNEGDELLLSTSPYRMRFAIYVRRGEETYDAVDQVPEQLRIRQLAARSFDRNGMMVGWELVDGQKLEGAIERLFADPTQHIFTIHYAAPGCYAARIDRA
jgi:hypothetical protein